jgi:hypothetical protein
MVLVKLVEPGTLREIPMQYTVEVTLRTKQPLTQEELLEIAQIGGVAVGRPGGRLLELMLTVIAPDAGRAMQRAVRLITLRVRREPVSIECRIVTAPRARAARRPPSRSASPDIERPRVANKK